MLGCVLLGSVAVAQEPEGSSVAEEVTEVVADLLVDEQAFLQLDLPELGFAAKEVAEEFKIAEAPSEVALRDSLQRGIDWAKANQNENGSWGSAGRTKSLNIHAPGQASHRAYRTGTSSLMLMGLLALEDRYPEVAPMLEGGRDYLLVDLPKLRRYDQTVFYNVWGHAYGIRALVGLIERESDEDMKGRMRELVKDQLVQLGRMEVLGGGWAYYGNEALDLRPNGNSNSFVSATVMVALFEAKQAGFEIDEKVVERELRFLTLDRNPDGTYLYSNGFLNARANDINRTEGSLARSQACNLALYLWEQNEVVDEGDLEKWVGLLVEKHGWLDLGRMKPVPHESFFGIAGYFYHYGLYYGCMSAAQLDDELRIKFGGHLSGYLVERQRKDGSWFDYPLYNYGSAYGTGYALASLAALLPEKSEDSGN